MKSVYTKIKSLRVKYNITLMQLAEKTGLSVSFLSQVEKGNTNLAITSLKKIADAYDINMNYFFDDDENSSYMTTQENQKKFTFDGIEEEFIRLNGRFRGREMEPFHVTVLPNTISTNKFTHQGEEFYYILKGEITFTIEDEIYTVQQGESIHFPSYLPHNFENKAHETAEFINVVTPKLL